MSSPAQAVESGNHWCSADHLSLCRFLSCNIMEADDSKKEVRDHVRQKLRLYLTVLGSVAGLTMTFFQLDDIRLILDRPELNVWESVLALVLGALVGAVLGMSLGPLTHLLETKLTRMPLTDIIFGAVGLIVGLVIGSLLAVIFTRIPWLGAVIAPLAGVVCGYLGVVIAAKKREEVPKALGNMRNPAGRERSGQTTEYGQPKILDTSVIIDGRIADIVKTGFLEGPLIIPGFVLEELRHIADSSDVLKRNRGRRGLDILNRIQKELGTSVQIYEKDIPGNLEVDDKLLRVAKLLSGKVITNDFNLNKVAELQGVAVLNINELANAVKPAVLPGEEMVVNIIKDGKETGQGVAYLDDGTMIVVDGGKRHIGETIGVLVTSVLQTAAGRMIFAKPKNGNSGHMSAERVAP